MYDVKGIINPEISSFLLVRSRKLKLIPCKQRANTQRALTMSPPACGFLHFLENEERRRDAPEGGQNSSARFKLVFEYDGWSLKLLECPFTLWRTFARRTCTIGGINLDRGNSTKNKLLHQQRPTNISTSRVLFHVWAKKFLHVDNVPSSLIFITAKRKCIGKGDCRIDTGLLIFLFAKNFTASRCVFRIGHGHRREKKV